MFEDLNSYSETSITIDGINYLELKLFPFYRTPRPVISIARAEMLMLAHCGMMLMIANPAVVEDWHVPVPLIDFSKVRDDNWDITAQRVGTLPRAFQASPAVRAARGSLIIACFALTWPFGVVGLGAY
jgi:hypothetical protein